MSQIESDEVDVSGAELRRCPWCASFDTTLIHRGYTGPTDERDQYFTCNSCSQVTFELICRSAREMRLGRYRAGGIWRDAAHNNRYQISRVLKVGVNEYLVYVRPLDTKFEPAVHR